MLHSYQLQGMQKESPEQRGVVGFGSLSSGCCPLPDSSLDVLPDLATRWRLNSIRSSLRSGLTLRAFGELWRNEGVDFFLSLNSGNQPERSFTGDCRKGGLLHKVLSPVI